jgi:AraC-like DNA-binding protein
MAQRGTSTFSNPTAYAAAFGETRISLTITHGGDFWAELTKLYLLHVNVLRCGERLPRVGVICLPAGRISLTFPIGKTSLVTNGRASARGEMALHGPGERIYQLCDGNSRWGLISFAPEHLLSSFRALTGRALDIRSAAKYFCATRTNATRFQRIIAQACQLSESPHRLVERPEVARAVEQELIHAVVNCLLTNEEIEDSAKARRHSAIMTRFEAALGSRDARKPNIPELCADIGVPERTLRACCASFLGIGPVKYLLLRRLNEARLVLQKAHPSTSSVAEIARAFQFYELGRFADSYRSVFGELPSATLQRSSEIPR